MSVWADELVHQLEHDHGMTEEQAVELYWALSRRYGWTGSVFTHKDVDVFVHADEDGYGDSETAGWDEKEEYLTEAVRDRLASSWVWRDGIPGALTERGNEFLPSVNVYPSGEFDIYDNIMQSAQRFRADGSRKELDPAQEA